MNNLSFLKINKKFFTIFLSIFILLVIAGIFLQRHAFACRLIPFLGYEKLNDQLFIAGDISLENSAALQQLMDSASARINKVYGQPDSKPRIFITSDLQTAKRWGANDTASMHRLPWCSCIIIGPQGQNVDVLAHEWLHAEIQHRVGFWRFLFEVPVWFDEGAALTLDYREPFLPGNINLPASKILSVQQLERGKDFFSGDIMENYQAARMAVAPSINNRSFFKDLDQVADGKPFTTVFLQKN
jgi:hypothetical protein